MVTTGGEAGRGYYIILAKLLDARYGSSIMSTQILEVSLLGV